MKLDYTIETQQQRTNAIADLASTGSINRREASAMADYILWGSGPSGLRPQDCAREGGYELTSKHGHWDHHTNETSLDAYLDAGLTPALSDGTPIGVPPKQRFDRTRAREQAPPHILASLEAIWKQCDTLEVTVDSYAIHHGLRTKPIRKEMHERLTAAEFAQCEEQAKHITQQQYLAMRHQLIDLRTEQYSLRDSYASYRQRRTVSPPIGSDTIEIPILPVSLRDTILGKWPEPGDDIQYWEAKPGEAELLHIDFREPEHLAKLFDIYNDIKAEISVPHVSLEECESILPQLFMMLQYYVSIADLSPMHMDILKMKVNHISNRAIAAAVAERYGKSYGENYISTIYHKKILQQIAETVELHYATLKKINDPTAFKKCIDCGRVLLKDPANFMRKKRVIDGFAPRCKKCAAIKRTQSARSK